MTAENGVDGREHALERQASMRPRPMTAENEFMARLVDHWQTLQ